MIYKTIPFPGLLESVEEWFPSIEPTECFIAGGFIRSCYMGKPPKDMDIFFKDLNCLEMVEQRLRCLGYKRTKKTIFAITYCKEDKTIQLILNRVGNLEDILNQFDFTVCQAALIGENLYVAENFFEDIEQRKLVTTPAALNRWATTLERMFRYASYGFLPSRTEMDSIVRLVKESEVEDLHVDAQIKREIATGRAHGGTAYTEEASH
jgi:hypothetical protein